MKRKSKITLLLIACVVIVLIPAGIQLSFTFYFDDQIKNDLQQEVAHQTQNEYKLEIDGFKIDIFNRSIHISGFLFKPALNANPESPEYYASAREINLNKFSLIAFLFNKNLTISNVELIDPAGSVYRYSSKKIKPGISNEKQFTIYGLFNKYANALRILHIKINGANIAVYDSYLDTIPAISSTDNELEISDLQINKSVDDANRLFIADKLHLIIRHFSYTPRDSLYTFHVRTLMASYFDSRLVLDSLELVPNYSKKEFSNEAGKQIDRFKITIAKLDFMNMDVKLFFERNWFIAKDLLIDEFIISAYRNKNHRRKAERPGSVQQLLENIPFYAAIDTIKLNKSHIIYEELAEGSLVPGKITFSEVNGLITGFTSDSTLFSKYKKLQVHAQAKFMNSGILKAYYSFPLNTNNMIFDCAGTLTNMPFEDINPMLVPNAHISMMGGTIDTMEFSFHANETASKGNMKFRYHNLKMEFLNKTSHKAGFGKDVLSFLTHEIFIKESNPSNNHSPRETTIEYTRDPSHFIFNYTWKSIWSGIKPAIGVPAL